MASAPCQAVLSGLEMEICALSRLDHRICARKHAQRSGLVAGGETNGGGALGSQSSATPRR